MATHNDKRERCEIERQAAELSLEAGRDMRDIAAPLRDDEKQQILARLLHERRGARRQHTARAAKVPAAALRPRRTACVMAALGACAFCVLFARAHGGSSPQVPSSEPERIAALQRDAASLTQLAELQQRNQRLGDAELLYKQALSIKERAWGPEHVELTSTLTQLADLYASQHRDAKAKPLYRRAYAIQPSEVF